MLTSLIKRTALLTAVIVVVFLPEFAFSWRRATGPRLDNLTDIEIEYAHLYWKYRVIDRIVRPSGTARRPEPGRADLGYKFITPLPERLAGITYVGHAARLRLVLERARSGEALRVGALGGSITFGQGAGGSESTYAAAFVDWLNAALPPNRPPSHAASLAAPGTAAAGNASSAAAAAAVTAAAAVDVSDGELQQPRLLVSGSSAAMADATDAESDEDGVGDEGEGGVGMRGGKGSGKHRSGGSGAEEEEGGDPRQPAGVAIDAPVAASRAGKRGSGGRQRRGRAPVAAAATGVAVAVAGGGVAGSGGLQQPRRPQQLPQGLRSRDHTDSGGGGGGIGERRSKSRRNGRGSSSGSGGAGGGGGKRKEGGGLEKNSEGGGAHGSSSRKRRRHFRGLSEADDGAAAAAAAPEAATAATSAAATAAVPHQHVRHQYVNGAVPGTQSGYMSSCLAHHLPPGVDLLMLEYAVNDSPAPSTTLADPSRRAFERLVRKLLRLRSRPAVLLVNMFAHGAAHGKYWHSAERDFAEYASYYGLPSVSLRAAVLPSAFASTTSADNNNNSTSSSSGGGSNSGSSRVHLGSVFNGGKHHPGRGGHVVMAELLISLALELLHSNSRLATQQDPRDASSLDLLTTTTSTTTSAAPDDSSSTATPQHRRRRRKLHSTHDTGATATTSTSTSTTTSSPQLGATADAAAAAGTSAASGAIGVLSPDAAAALAAVAARPLPPPLSEGNYEAASSTCYLAQQLRELALQPAEGWEWTDEGRGKWGWVALEENRQLRIQVSTQVAGGSTPPSAASSPAAAAPIILQLAYLQSYSDMGAAALSCEGGCSCEPLRVDAHSGRRVSVTSMADVKVSQHPSCVLLLNTTGPSKEARKAAAAAAAAAGSDNSDSSSGSSMEGTVAGSKFKLLGLVVGEEPGASAGTVTWLRPESHEMAQLVQSMGDSGQVGNYSQPNHYG